MTTRDGTGRGVEGLRVGDIMIGARGEVRGTVTRADSFAGIVTVTLDYVLRLHFTIGETVRVVDDCRDLIGFRLQCVVAQ